MRLDGDAASAVVGMTIVSKTRREAAKLYGLVLYHRGLLRALGERTNHGRYHKWPKIR